MKTRKTILGIIVTLVLLTMLVVPASPIAADNAVSIGLATTQVPVGSNFIAWVNIDAVSNLDTAQYDITYDPAV